MPKIPDFGRPELDYVRGAFNERFSQPVEIHPTDAELRLGAADDSLTACPAVLPQAGTRAMTACCGRRWRCCRGWRTMNGNAIA